MTEYLQQDLSGSRFDQVLLKGADFHGVRFTDAHFRDVDLCGLDVRGAVLTGTLRGVEFWDEEWEHRLYAERDLGVIEEEG